jgi:hypothetical protein
MPRRVCVIYAIIATCGANNLSSDLTLYRYPIDDHMTKAIETCVLQRKDGLVFTQSVVACYQELVKNETEAPYLLPDDTVYFAWPRILDYYVAHPLAQEGAPVRWPWKDRQPNSVDKKHK